MGAVGRSFKLDLRNRFLMVLIYYRLYITYTLTGYLLNLDQINVYRNIQQKIEGLIRTCLPIPQNLYKITKRLKTPEEIEEYFPGFMAFVDFSEQQIPHPKNKTRRRLYYSGKKKNHTIKNLYMANNDEIILYKTRHKQVGGRKHDYKIYKKNHHVTPKEVENILDPGFLGVEKDHHEQISSLSIKKKWNQNLTMEEKEYNRIHSKKRIAVEHTIFRIKKYRIMRDILRNRLKKYDEVSDIISGLVNCRIMNSS